MPFDADEHTDRDRIIRLIDRPNNPFDRASYEPGHITASLFVVTPDHSLAAMILHRKLNRWLQPGGHVDDADGTVLDGALREAREETGLELNRNNAKLFDLDVHPIPATETEPAHSHFDIRYLVETQYEDLVAGEDVAEASWKFVSEWENSSTDEGLRRAAKKLRRLG